MGLGKPPALSLYHQVAGTSVEQAHWRLRLASVVSVISRLESRGSVWRVTVARRMSTRGHCWHTATCHLCGHTSPLFSAESSSLFPQQIWGMTGTQKRMTHGNDPRQQISEPILLVPQFRSDAERGQRVGGGVWISHKGWM